MKGWKTGKSSGEKSLCTFPWMPKREQLRTFLRMYVCIKGETWDIHKGKSGLENLWPEPAFPGLKGTNDLVVWGGGAQSTDSRERCPVASAKQTSKSVVCCPVLILTLSLTVIYFQDVLWGNHPLWRINLGARKTLIILPSLTIILSLDILFWLKRKVGLHLLKTNLEPKGYLFSILHNLILFL